MKISLDPWAEDAANPQAGLNAHQGNVESQLEVKKWQHLQGVSVPGSLKTLHVVDGTRRLDARVLVAGEQAQLYGGFGIYAVGHACLSLHSGRATIQDIVSERTLLVSGVCEGEDVSLNLPKGGSGKLVYRLTQDPRARNERQTPLSMLQSLMLRREQGMSRTLAMDLDTVEDGQLELDTLVLQDGRIDIGSEDKLILGYIKTLETEYLGLEEKALLLNLECGERTPIFYFQYGDASKGRYSWYVRLCDPLPYQPQGAGLVRLEMTAPEDFERIPRVVKKVADFSPALLGRLSSVAHKDRRAPQNLIPTGALERELSRRLGDPALIARRIRQWVMMQG